MSSTLTIPGLSATPLDIISGAMRAINVLTSGATPTAEEAQDALVIANQMLDSWNAQRLMVFVVQRQVFDLTNLKQIYTMGPGGDFNTARPAKIDRISVISYNNSTQPLELPLDYITQQDWQYIPTKNITSSLPQVVWDDQQFPLRNLSFWPIPNQFPLSTAIYDWVALTYFANLTTSYSFPPGYLEALRFNLAVKIAPDFGATALATLPVVSQLAQQSKDVIEAINAPLVDLKCDAALVTSYQGLYNYITDEGVRR